MLKSRWLPNQYFALYSTNEFFNTIAPFRSFPIPFRGLSGNPPGDIFWGQYRAIPHHLETRPNTILKHNISLSIRLRSFSTLGNGWWLFPGGR